MKGIIETPLDRGLKQLNWVVGAAFVRNTGNTNPIVPFRVDKDADFLLKRLWMVQYPNVTGNANASELNLNTGALSNVLGAQLLLRDGGSKRALGLTGVIADLVALDTAAAKGPAAWLGLPAPLLIPANSNLYAEITNPLAGAAPANYWSGDLYLVGEGFKIYKGQPDPIPSTLRDYALPFSLSGQVVLANPATAAVNVQGQYLTLTNNGEGRFLAKRLSLKFIASNGADVTDTLMNALGLQINDSTSGGKNWISNPTLGASGGSAQCPARILTMHRSYLPWCTPRYLDENGSIQMQFVFANTATDIAYLNAGGAPWPVTAHVNIDGALIPLGAKA
jgi:hypothetical protein